MPRRFTTQQRSSSEITRDINNKLQSLKLVKDRRSKNINEEPNQITELPPTKTSFNNDADDGDGDSDNDTVCVQKVIQVP